MNELRGETIALSKLFSRDFFFRVPEYQRPFSWENDNFEDLVNDLVDADRSQEYFLGTLVLQRKDGCNHDIVDGQQRLTAISILLACIRDLIDDSGYKEEIQAKLQQNENKLDGVPAKIRLEVKDRDVYKDNVLTQGGTLAGHSEKGLPEPTWRYVRAINIFKQKLDFLSQQELQYIAVFISQKCVFIYLSTSTFDDAFRLFTIVNDRGLQLRRIDILKSSNIDPSIVTSETVRNRLAHQWEELEKDVGEDVFENILHMIRLSLVKEKPQSDLLKEFEEKIFKKKILNKGEDFFDIVSSYVAAYKKIFEDRDIDIDDEVTANKFKSLIFIMKSEFKASEWKACVLYFALEFGYEHLYDFILKIEKVYLSQWVRGVRKDERFSDYSSILQLISGSSAGEAVVAKVIADEDAIIEACDNQNFYGAGYSKYYLLRLELISSEMDSPIDLSAKSVEHVLPQTPKADSDWGYWNDLTAIDEYVNKVGNLVLLSRSKNSSARNYDFERKKKVYLTPRVSTYPRCVQVLTNAEWGKDVIEERTQKVKEDILLDI